MGIALASLAMLLVEHKKRPFSGTVLQVGRQDIYFDLARVQALACELGLTLPVVDKVNYKANEWMPGVQTIDDITFFKAIGFDRVESIDASDYENADHVHDFNVPVPETLHGRYDLVFDGGSFEHIFHLPNALANMNSLLKVGGRAIHHSPTHNFVDHGFYSFSPTFFFDYYEANRYADLDCYLLGCKVPYQHNAMPKLYKYMPGMMEPYSVGGVTREKFDGCDMLITTFTATKKADSVGDIMPVQRRYQQWWTKAKTTSG